MRHLSLVFLFLLAVPCLALAGDPSPLLQTGSKALLFDLGGLATLAAGNYQGGLGGKYYVAKDLAIRLSLGFSTSTETDKNTQAPPLPANTLTESKLSHTTFSLAPGVTYAIATSSTVAAYVGGMVTISTTSQKREGNSAGLFVGFDSGESYRVSTTDWGFAGILGVEWWPWENISLSGEYRLGFTHSSGQTESSTPGVTVTTDAPTTNSFGLGSANSAALTLGVYF
jgi:opacity protein-like surface antigen